MKKLVVSMFFMVAASFFIVCGVSAAQHYVYAGFSVPSTFTFTDTVTYNVGNRSYGTAAYIDITWNWADYRNFYNSKGASISVAGADFYGDIELISVSASDPTIDCSLDGNRIRIYFNSNYNGKLNITLTYACNYTWYVGTITGSPAPADSLQDVTLRTNFTLTFGKLNFYDSSSIGMGDLNAKLDQILSELSGGSIVPDYLGDDAYFYFSSDYFTYAWTTQAEYFSDDGYLRLTTGAANGIQFYNLPNNNYLQDVSLPPGTYILSLAIPGSVSDITSVLGDSYSDSSLVVANGYTYFTGIITTSSIVNTHSFSIYWTGTSDTGIIYGGVSSAPSDYLAGSAVNPDQSGLVSDVDSAGQQQQSQEEQLWTNINNYKGDLTFNLDDWSEAAGGLSYVSGIFMQIWNNSPTQVVILSLMLGIAMLSIGRGAMSDVLVSRNKRDDD